MKFIFVVDKGPLVIILEVTEKLSRRVFQNRLVVDNPLSYRAYQAVDVCGPGHSGWQGDHDGSSVGHIGKLHLHVLDSSNSGLGQYPLF